MEGFNPENFETPKYEYTFTDTKMLGHPVIFSCRASDGLKARELFDQYLAENNIDVEDSDISCSEIKI